MTKDVMNGAMNRKVLFLLGPVAGIVMFAAVMWMVSQLLNREYRDAYRAPAATVDRTTGEEVYTGIGVRPLRLAKLLQSESTARMGIMDTRSVAWRV